MWSIDDIDDTDDTGDIDIDRFFICQRRVCWQLQLRRLTPRMKAIVIIDGVVGSVAVILGVTVVIMTWRMRRVVPSFASTSDGHHLPVQRGAVKTPSIPSTPIPAGYNGGAHLAFPHTHRTIQTPRFSMVLGQQTPGSFLYRASLAPRALPKICKQRHSPFAWPLFRNAPVVIRRSNQQRNCLGFGKCMHTCRVSLQEVLWLGWDQELPSSSPSSSEMIQMN